MKVNLDFSVNDLEYKDRDAIREAAKKIFMENIKPHFDPNMNSALKAGITEIFREAINPELLKVLLEKTVYDVIKKEVVGKVDVVVERSLQETVGQLETMQKKVLHVFAMNESKLSNIFRGDCDADNVTISLFNVDLTKYSGMKSSRSDKKITVEEIAILILQEKFDAIMRFDTWATGRSCWTPSQKELLNQLLVEKRNGRPDLVACLDKGIFFIEVKSAGDGLHLDQAMWIKNHPHCLVNLMFIYDRPNDVIKISALDDEDNEDGDNKYMEEKK